MARNLTTAFTEEIDKSALQYCLMSKAEFDSGDVNVWTGLGDLSYDGDTYQGAGNLLGISAVEETKAIEAKGTRFTMSGIPESHISLAFNEDYQGRPVTLFFAVIDELGEVIPHKLFSGYMDIMEIEDTGATATIFIDAESDLIRLTTANDSKYTPEDQKSRFDGDKGLDFIPIIADLDITWGS